DDGRDGRCTGSMRGSRPRRIAEVRAGDRLPDRREVVGRLPAEHSGAALKEWGMLRRTLHTAKYLSDPVYAAARLRRNAVGAAGNGGNPRRPDLTDPSADRIPGQGGLTSGYAMSRSALIASITTAVAPWMP